MNLEKDPTQKQRKVNIVWLAFGVYLIIFIANLNISSNPNNATNSMWLYLSAYTLAFSVFLLIKNKLPNKKQIGIALLLALFVYIAYCGFGTFLSFSQIQGSISTFAATCAYFSVYNKFKEGSLKLVKSIDAKNIVLSIMIGIIVGVVLGAVNYFLMIGSNEVDYSLNLSRIIVALSPAILEEMVYRAVLYSFCLYLLGGTIISKSASFICWVMMIMPHVLAHTPSYFMQGGLINGLVSTLLLSAIFGLPFAILQRKRDITSAMVAHGIVDAIRFTIFGI